MLTAKQIEAVRDYAEEIATGDPEYVVLAKSITELADAHKRVAELLDGLEWDTRDDNSAEGMALRAHAVELRRALEGG